MKYRTALQITREAGRCMPSCHLESQFMRWVMRAPESDIVRIQAYIERKGAYKMDAVLANGLICRGRYRAKERPYIHGGTSDWNYYGRRRGDGKGEGEP